MVKITAPYSPFAIPPFAKSLPLTDRLIDTLRRAGIELARPAELLVRVLDHFLPLRDPADGAGEREQHREHGGWEAHGAQRDAGIEVDVRIELLFDEVFVVQRDALGLDGDVEERIVDAELAQHLVASLLHQLGARIVVLVDAMAESHQAE